MLWVFFVLIVLLLFRSTKPLGWVKNTGGHVECERWETYRGDDGFGKNGHGWCTGPSILRPAFEQVGQGGVGVLVIGYRQHQHHVWVGGEL